MKLKRVIAGSLMSLASLGCGATDEWEDPAVTSASSALLPGQSVGSTEQVSFFSTDWTSTAWQSETAGAFLNGFYYAAFNAEDTNTSHVTYPQRVERDSSNRPYVDRIVCPGTSQVGRALFDSSIGVWAAKRMPLPAGWDVLWGDPSVAVWEGNWWVSALGSPTDRFRATANTTVNGRSCFRNSDYPL